MRDVGRYKVVRCIGRGGQAEVLEAVAVGGSGFQRRVAIKRLLAEGVASEDITRMFVDEANIASRLHHANIAGVLDFGFVDGVPFQVLEFVDGLDARALYNAGVETGHPLPVEVALHLCTEVAHALACAHGLRDAANVPLALTHRDVKPGNILVSWNGDVKLTDFGIAFSRERQAERTGTGVLKGTPTYMAPEQVIGAEVDARTDIFALGCVLHFLLTGKSPMAVEDNLSTLMGGGTLKLDPTLPSDVAAIVARATQGAREARFASAAAMATAAGAALAHRLDRDAKSLLLEWLATIRVEIPPAARPGRFDGLLGDVVLTAVDNEVRRFAGTTTRRDAPSSEAGEPDALPMAWSSGRRRLALVAAGIAICAGAAIAWPKGEAPPAAAAPQASFAAAPSVALPALPLAPGTTAPVPALSASAIAPPVPGPSPARAVRSTSVSTSTPPMTPTVAAPLAADAPAAPGNGPAEDQDAGDFVRQRK